jgi:hypothetical protein
MSKLQNWKNHSKPETRETAAPQADEAEAQRRADSRAPNQFNPCRSASASQRVN